MATAHPDAETQAADAFRRFVNVCQELARQLTPDDSPLRSFVPPRLRPRALAEAAEKTPQFTQFADVLSKLAPPRDDTPSAIRAARLVALQAHMIGAATDLDSAMHELREKRRRAEVRNFLRGWGFYDKTLAGSETDFDAVLKDFRQSPEYDATSLVAIDGIRLQGGDVSINATTRLRTLGKKELDEFFRNEMAEGFDVGFDTKGFIGKVFLEQHHPNSPQFEELWQWRPNDLVEPWLSYINMMITEGTVHVGERFFRSNSMRDFPHFVAETRSDGTHTPGQRPEWYLYSSSPDDLECDSTKLHQFLEILEQGRTGAKPRNQARIALALGVFARACRGFYEERLRYNLPGGSDDFSLTIIDFWTVLEVMFAQREDPEPLVAERAAALLAREEKDREHDFRERLIEIKRIRNRLVHGRNSPNVEELKDAVAALRIWVATCLTWFVQVANTWRTGLADVGSTI